MEKAHKKIVSILLATVSAACMSACSCKPAQIIDDYDMYDTLYRLYTKYSELYGDKIEFVNIEEMAMLQRLYVGMNAER